MCARMGATMLTLTNMRMMRAIRAIKAGPKQILAPLQAADYRPRRRDDAKQQNDTNQQNGTNQQNDTDQPNDKSLHDTNEQREIHRSPTEHIIKHHNETNPQSQTNHWIRESG